MVIEPESIGRMTPKSEDFKFSLSPLFNSKDKDSLPLMFAFSSSQKVFET